jgi:hypothetical protein
VGANAPKTKLIFNANYHFLTICAPLAEGYAHTHADKQVPSTPVTEGLQFAVPGVRTLLIFISTYALYWASLLAHPKVFASHLTLDNSFATGYGHGRCLVAKKIKWERKPKSQPHLYNLAV